MSRVISAIILAVALIVAGWQSSLSGVRLINRQLDIMRQAAEEEGGSLRILPGEHRPIRS